MTLSPALLYNARGLPLPSPGEGISALQASRLLQVLGAIASRSSIAARLGQSFGGDRDLYEALGYTKTLRYENYYARYDRQDIAKAVIDRPVEDSWRLDPIVTDGDEESAFSKAWADMAQERNIYHYLQRVDKIASLGLYGVLVLGLDDLGPNEPLSTPAKTATQLLYLAPHTELSASITQWDRRVSSPRFGRPEIYTVTTSLDTVSGMGGMILPGRPTDTRETGGSNNGFSSDSLSQLVHHSRILHVVEDPLDSDVFGTPGLRAIYNRLEDLEKIVGGAGEMFWRGARKEMALIADKDANIGTQAKADLKTEVEAFIHEAQTFLRLDGFDLKSIAPAVADPRSHFEVAIDLICATRGIPKRILIGNEQGERSSTQDLKDWNRRCDVRRHKHNETQILRAMVKRTIELGVIPAPAKGKFEVTWPDLDAPSDADRAKIAQLLSAALQSYANARKVGLVLPFEIYLREILTWDQKRMEQAEAVAGKSFAQLEEEARAEAEKNRQALVSKGQGPQREQEEEAA